jgi:phenylacetate-CoA ligase
MQISIVVPCLNEAGNIRATFERILKSLDSIDFEVVYVNDGSKDDTQLEINRLVAEYPGVVSTLEHEENKGIPEAWASGLSISKYQNICFIDGDLQNPPEAIPNLLKSFVEEQADLVQGSRSSIGRIKDQRLIFSRGLNSILNFVFRQEAKDSKSGFLIAPRHVLEIILKDRKRFTNFQTFIGVSARSHGFRVVEVETLFQSREVGESFLTARKILFVLFTTLKDLVIGLSLFRFSQGNYEFNFQKDKIKGNLSLLRRFRFHLFFLTMPLHKWIIGRNAKSLYYWLKNTEYCTREELDNLQLLRLRKMLQHAYIHVPYYKRAFDKVGFKPLEMQALSDLARVPLLSKADVRQNVHFSLFSDTHVKKQMHRINTSGSTGEPFVCYADKFQLEMRFATTLRALEMSGWEFGDRQIRLWHQTLGMSPIQAFKEKTDALFMRRKFIPAFEMTEESIQVLMRTIEKFKPILIDGYAESLNLISIASSSKAAHSPKAVMSSAQQLTDSTRSRIEAQFGAKVLDKYGSREFSGIAYQCLDSANHHVQDESYIVEILVDGRTALPGEIGEIVITDMNNFSMPLIRYRIGDLAKAVEQEACRCGRSHKQIGEITGRTQALIACKNGVWLPGTFFAHFFKDYDFAIRHYQVVQETIDGFEVRVVPNPQFNQSIESEIIRELHTYTGQGTQIKVVLVDEIPLLKTGKRTPVISKVPYDFQDIGENNLITRADVILSDED